MTAAAFWEALFRAWPASIPRTGIAITPQEAIQFNDFLVQEGIVIIQRERPDSLGARKVMIAFDALQSVKLTDTLDFSAFRQMGFE